MLLSIEHTIGTRAKAYVLVCALCTVMQSWFAVELRAALPVPSPVSLQPVDTVKYHPYSYIRFIKDGNCPEINDEQFYDWAGKVIFPINKYDLPKRDSLLTQLQRELPQHGLNLKAFFLSEIEDDLEIVHKLACACYG